jgi:murein L,D-transpeptidase YafK
MMLPLLAALSIAQPALPTPADAAFRMPRSARLVVAKSKHELMVVAGESVLRTYRVGLGLEPRMPKETQGDFATPEGNYFVCSKNPKSKFGLSIGVSYPNPNDAERGLDAKLITAEDHDRIIAAFVKRAAPPMNTKLGGQIMIHGQSSSWDWTDGCVALNTQDIEELFQAVPIGTPIEILP